MKLLTITPVYNFEQPGDDFGGYILVEFFNSQQTKPFLVSLYVRDCKHLRSHMMSSGHGWMRGERNTRGLVRLFNVIKQQRCSSRVRQWKGMKTFTDIDFVSLFECLSITVSSSCTKYKCAQGMTDRVGTSNFRLRQPTTTPPLPLPCPFPAIERNRINFEVSPFISYIQTVHIVYTFTYIINRWGKKQTNKKLPSNCNTQLRRHAECKYWFSTRTYSTYTRVHACIRTDRYTPPPLYAQEHQLHKRTYTKLLFHIHVHAHTHTSTHT